MTFSHFSDSPIREIRSSPQYPNSYKPEGLWLSVDGEDDWLSCSAAMKSVMEQGFDCRNKLRHVVTLAEGHCVLSLDTLEKLSAFDREYGYQRESLGTFIDWERVAQDHDGIIISPYWGKSPGEDFFWYLGWDCASGCIWHPRAVARIEIVPLVQEPVAAVLPAVPCYGMK